MQASVAERATPFWQSRPFRYIVNGVFATAVHFAVLTFNLKVLGFASAGLANLVAAVFGITKEAYIVFAANAFALMGLRQLYFLLQGLMGRLRYLNYGLAIILAFIAVKLILEAVHETTSIAVPLLPIWLSLSFIVGVLAVTTVLSLRAPVQPDDGNVRPPQSAPEQHG